MTTMVIITITATFLNRDHIPYKPQYVPYHNVVVSILFSIFSVLLYCGISVYQQSLTSCKEPQVRVLVS